MKHYLDTTCFNDWRVNIPAKDMRGYLHSIGGIRKNCPTCNTLQNVKLHYDLEFCIKCYYCGYSSNKVHPLDDPNGKNPNSWKWAIGEVQKEWHKCNTSE